MNSKKLPGIPFVLSGPSGCGKGTIVKELLKKYPDTYALSVSATTREPRVGEENGVHYHFISRDEFERRIDAQQILEYTTYSAITTAHRRRSCMSARYRVSM